MKNLKYPFGTVTITKKSKSLINSLLNSGRVSGGKCVREFEKRFADLTGVKEAVAVSSGAAADALALAVLYDFGAKRGDEVIIPALSFAATGNAVLEAGFVPKFVDIERETLNINPEKIEGAITERTKAIMPVHLMGKPAAMDEINAIAKRHKLYVIEDAAEAQGAVYKKKNIGQLGDMAAFSLYVAHIISTIEGGMITTDNGAFAQILRSLRAHGRACKCDKCVVNISSSYCAKRFRGGKDIRFIFERIGFSSKMHELEAAVGLGYLDEYPKIFKKRARNLASLNKKFQDYGSYFYTIQEESFEKLAPYALALVLKQGVRFSRDEFMCYLEASGIEARTLFASMPTQCPGFKFLGYLQGDFPEAEYIGDNGLHIGVHQDISEEQIDYFIKVTGKFLKNRQ